MLSIRRRAFLKSLALLGVVYPRGLAAAADEPRELPYFIGPATAPEVRTQWQRYRQSVTCAQGKKMLQRVVLVGVGPDGTAFLVPKRPNREGTFAVQLGFAFHLDFLSAQPGDYRAFTSLSGHSIVYTLASGDPAKPEFWAQEVKNIDYTDKQGHPTLAGELGMPEGARFVVGGEARPTAVLCYSGLWFEGLVKDGNLASIKPMAAPSHFTPKFFDCTPVLGDY